MTRGEWPARAAASRAQAALAARLAFEQGRYREALDQYQRAYETTGAPALLYEIGQSADRLRLDATTLRAFQLYLERFPDAPNREEVRNRIRALESPVRTEGADLDAESLKGARGKRASALHESLIPSPYTPAATARAQDSAQPRVLHEPLMPSPYKAPAPDSVPPNGVLDSPWFWIGTGAVTVLVTTLVVVVVATSVGGTGARAQASTSSP